MVIAACGSGKDSANAATVLETHAQAKTAASQEEEMVGAFRANQGSLSPADNQDAMKAFNAAVEGMTGYQYEVLAVLGSQVVAGTNYAYLCRGTVVYPGASPSYLLVNVYEDLDGKAEISGARELLQEKSGSGWQYNNGESAIQDNPEVQAAVKAALAGKTGSLYEPLAYLGSQGSTYAIFCARRTEPGADRSFAILTIGSQADGTKTIVNTEDVDLSTAGAN